MHQSDRQQCASTVCCCCWLINLLCLLFLQPIRRLTHGVERASGRDQWAGILRQSVSQGRSMRKKEESISKNTLRQIFMYPRLPCRDRGRHWGVGCEKYQEGKHCWLALAAAKDGTLTRINKRGILLKDFTPSLSLFRVIEEAVVVYRYHIREFKIYEATVVTTPQILHI